MTWVKLDSAFWGDDRVLGVPPEAALLYLAAMSWCADHHTDGHVTRQQRVVIASSARTRRVAKSSADLVAARLWDETPDGWYLPDYPQWGPLADTASYQAERNREKQQRYRDRQQSNRVSNPVTDPVSNPGSNGSRNRLVTGLEKSREEEIPPVVPHGGTQQRKAPRKSQIPEDFEPDPNQRRWAAEERPGVDLRAEVLKFVDYHRSKGNTFVDHQRAFRTWLRNTRAAPTNGQTPDPFGPPRYRIIGSVPP